MAIGSGEVLEGLLPNNNMKLVQAWLEIHRDEIMANGSLALKGFPIERVKPLE